jgi:lipoprotein NlpI
MMFALSVLAGRTLAETGRGCGRMSGDEEIAACTHNITSGKSSGQELAVSYYNRGLAYNAKGDSDRAIADYNEAIRLDPKDAAAYNSRSIAYNAKGDFDRAIADYNQAIQLDPNAARYFNRGYSYNAKGDFDRAIADYNEAIRLDPKDAAAYNSRGIAYNAKGDFDRAIADYNQAVRLDPNAARYYNRGYSYNAKGDFDRAIADLNEAIRLDPKDAVKFYTRGIVNLYAGSVSKAQLDLNQAAQLDPSYAYTALWLDVVNKRSDRSSRLPQVISQLDMTKWPAPLVRMYLGQMTPEAVLVAAGNANADTKRRQICEANFFSGELALQRGAKDEAIQLLRLAANDCPKTFIEWRAANAELKTLGMAP